MRHALVWAIGLGVAACSKPPPETTTSPGATATATSSTTATTSSSGGIKWTDPTGWRRRPPQSTMRVAEYTVPRAGGDTEDAECIVYSFGPGQGGSAQANIDRWKSQFTGGPPGTVSTSDVGGIHVTRLEISGTYAGGMPTPGAPATGPKPSQRMIATVVEAPNETFFFKLTGPDATVKAAGDAFDRMMRSLAR